MESTITTISSKDKASATIFNILSQHHKFNTDWLMMKIALFALSDVAISEICILEHADTPQFQLKRKLTKNLLVQNQVVSLKIFLLFCRQMN